MNTIIAAVFKLRFTICVVPLQEADQSVAMIHLSDDYFAMRFGLSANFLLYVVVLTFLLYYIHRFCDTQSLHVEMYM